MRVTHNMMSDLVVLHLQRHAQQLADVQRQIATQKRLNKPSDDPIAMGQVLDYRRKLAVVDQYQENIQHGKLRIQTTELTLGVIDELMGLAREIAQQHSGMDIAVQDKQLAAKEVRDIYDQIVDLANSTFGANYIFSGHQTDTPPFGNVVEIAGGVPDDLVFGLTAAATNVTIEIRDQHGSVVRTLNFGDGVTPGSGGNEGVNSVAWDGLDNGGLLLADQQYTFTITAWDGSDTVQDYATYNGDDGQLPITIGENIKVGIDMDGRNYFAPSGGVNIFATLKDLVDALENPDLQAGSAQISATIDPLSQAREQLDLKRSEFGLSVYRLDQAENHWEHLRAMLEISISNREQADVTRAAIELNSLEIAYESTLATAARIVQPRLIDFLK